MAFKAGFVNIIGKPNAGKSTLMNALVGERMAIITPKPQTTRHRLIGILTDKDFQIVFSDTPGYVEEPHYKMHEIMNSYVESTLEDADLMLFVMDVTDTYAAEDEIIQILKKSTAPVFIVLNKIDLIDQPTLEKLVAEWSQLLPESTVFPISATEKAEIDTLMRHIVRELPEGAAYYPDDQLTDRPERFFASEIVREKILLNYGKEIPYSSEVAIEDFKETTTKKGEPLLRIRTIIYVERDSQVAIMIGHEGRAIKRLGTMARKEMEKFFQTKVFLDITVKVKKNWRNDDKSLKWLGY